MHLKEARVQKYRSIRDSGTFQIERDKTIIVGPNEAGKTVLLRALQQINPPGGVANFDPLRDYPRSEYNDISTGKIDPANVTVAEATFSLDDDELEMVEPEFRSCQYVCGRRLDNTFWHRLEGAPGFTTFGEIEADLIRLANHADDQHDPESAGASPSEFLSALTNNWSSKTDFSQSENSAALEGWLKKTLPLVDEDNEKENQRFNRLMDIARYPVHAKRTLDALHQRLPVFILFSNYFRVHPRIHLEHMAGRLEQNLLDDEHYDYGNKCLLQLLGFSARELSRLGKAAEPAFGDAHALKNYQDQLDKRKYQLNAASVKITEELLRIWNPDKAKAEANRLRVEVDGQYLKVVVEDELGVEIELDQRSEGFRWLVSFFIVFFAEAAGKHKNSILLLDEPGMSLHGLKQREFRNTLSSLAERNQTVFTTHSPFLVGSDELDLVRVIEMTDRRVGTRVHTTLAADDPAALLPLQEALGYDLAQSLFSQQRNLILEGLTDYWYVEATCELVKQSGSEGLNPEIALIPAKSAGKVAYFATILHAHKLKVAALLDSDAAGDQAAKQDILVHRLGNNCILRTKDFSKAGVAKAEIEDLLRDTLVYVARSSLGWDISSQAEARPDLPIVEIFRAQIPAFSRYQLAKAYLGWTRENSHLGSADEEQQWQAFIKAVNRALA